MRRGNVLIYSVLGLSLLLSGCALPNATSTVGVLPTSASIGAIHGNVHGGQQPVVGSHVYVFAVGTAGYGGASVSLLQAGHGTVKDGDGRYYLATDASGSFDVTGDYACVPGTQVYLYAVSGDPGISGGTPGSNPNSAIGLLAGLGECPAGGTLATTVPTVTINEVTTVATAYALAGFAKDATDISGSSTTQGAVGLANAMANAVQLVSVRTGEVLTTTTSGYGTVPTALIGTVANILAACINSTGPASHSCATIFNAAPSPASGNPATDTASAAIYIAQRPANGVSELYALQSAYLQFAPNLTTQPNDFSLGVTYSPTSPVGPASATQVAVDPTGDVWVNYFGYADAKPTTDAVMQLSPTGQPLASTAPVAVLGQLQSPFGIDKSGNVWLGTSAAVFKFSKLGVLASPAAGYACATPTTGYDGANYSGAVAFGTGGTVYVKFIYYGNDVNATEYSGVAAFDPLDGVCSVVQDLDDLDLYYSNIGVDINDSLIVTSDNMVADLANGEGSQEGYYVQVAVDHANDVWASGGDDSFTLVKFNHTFDVITSLDGGGLGDSGAYSEIYDVSPPFIDGAGSVWMPFTSFDASSTFVSVITGATTDAVALTATPTGLVVPNGSGDTSVAVDLSGNLWTVARNSAGGNPTIVEYMGLGAPTAAPVNPAQQGTKP